MDIHRVADWLEQFIQGFDFKRPGRDQSLGRDVAMKVVENIHERVDEHEGPDGKAWDANAPDYAKWKEKKYGLVDEPNIRTGQMTSQQSLYGKTEIGQYEITMKYGTGEAPSRSAAPTGYLSKQDAETTDIEKAVFAHTGQSEHKILRPFYGVNEKDRKDIVELMQENLNDYIRDVG